ncbi:MAG TPA: glycosyltransferase [Candidatus Wunengus sp. YC60]|uniref:glycosyltransferase n=1 Tax=Candidatus Wunengus sp. YC60 TaxID=3367697 RepID=UPI00402765D5
MLKDPILSVVIASYESENTIIGCLSSLQNQSINENMEIIVVDSSTDNTATIIKETFPDSILYKFSERKFPGDARNFGVSKSRGEIIAFIDTDCVADKDWVEEIRKAHQSSYPVVGGIIANGNPESYIGWAAYFCEFSQWMPQSSRRYMVEIPTCCLSIKRWIFDKYGPFLEGTYSEDTAFHWKLGNDGHNPLFVPSIKVAHKNVRHLGKFIKKEFIHGRFFAKVRMSEQRFSILQRVIFIIVSPLLPFLLFFRIAMRVFGNRVYRSQFMFSSPMVFIGLISWSCGELLGYLSKQKR